MRTRDLRSVLLRQRRPGNHCEFAPAKAGPARIPHALPSTALLAGILALTLMPATTGHSQQDEKPLPEKYAIPPLAPVANPHPDANRMMEFEMQRQMVQKRIEELNTLRQKEMTADTLQLLKLAGELKIETNTAGPDTLSVFELRKVEAIEKLAHGVREKMKTTVN